MCESWNHTVYILFMVLFFPFRFQTVLWSGGQLGKLMIKQGRWGRIVRQLILMVIWGNSKDKRNWTMDQSQGLILSWNLEHLLTSLPQLTPFVPFAILPQSQRLVSLIHTHMLISVSFCIHVKKFNSLWWVKSFRSLGQCCTIPRGNWWREMRQLFQMSYMFTGYALIGMFKQ